MATCAVFGYIVDGSENPLSGISIQFVPAEIPAIISSTGQAIIPRTVETFTTSTGYFETNLLINTDFIVIINALGMKEKVRVPQVTSVNLFTLTGMYVSGEPVSTSTGNTEPNW
jgi:hypothetical protein